MSLTVYENGIFHSMDASVPDSEAVVVSQGKIAFIGSMQACHDYAGATHQRVDLAGAHVLPGFIDSHTHIGELAMQSSELDLSAASSMEHALEMVAQRGAASHQVHDSTEWLLGGHWNQQSWTGRSMPHRRQLDSVTGARPTALRSADMHSYWLNSAALIRLGIDATTPDPVGGSYLRDASGQLTGITTEAVTFALQDRFQELAGARLDSAIEATLQSFLRFGVTGIHDIDGLDVLRCFRELHEAKRLPLRVHKLLPMGGIDDYIAAGTRSGDGDAWLSLGAVKIFADGALSSRTCLLHDPFLGEQEYSGLEVTSLAQLSVLAQRCNAAGLAVAIHAIGDAGVDNAIDAIQSAREHQLLRGEQSSTRSVLPNRIEHVQHLARESLGRLVNSQAVACMQPASCTSDIDTVNHELGERSHISYGWRSLLDAGVTVAFSSDAPVEDINPFAGIFAATTRMRPDGSPAGGWQPRERITRLEAVTAYTRAGAVASGSSARSGTLKSGLNADFVAIDRDIFAVEDASVLRTTVSMTVIGGEVRWQR